MFAFLLSTRRKLLSISEIKVNRRKLLINQTSRRCGAHPLSAVGHYGCVVTRLAFRLVNACKPGILHVGFPLLFWVFLNSTFVRWKDTFDACAIIFFTSTLCFFSVSTAPKELREVDLTAKMSKSKKKKLKKRAKRNQQVRSPIINSILFSFYFLW